MSSPVRLTDHLDLKTSLKDKPLDQILNLLVKVQQNIICPICQDIMFTPCITACGHDFCYSCLNGWFQQNQQNPSCPTCRLKISERPSLCHNLRDLISTLIEVSDSASFKERKQEADDEYEEVIQTSNKLFPNMFNEVTMYSIYDSEDGVTRCPYCSHELELVDSNCCGYCGRRVATRPGSNDDEDESTDNDEHISSDDGSEVMESDWISYDEEGMASTLEDMRILEAFRNDISSSPDDSDDSDAPRVIRQRPYRSSYVINDSDDSDDSNDSDNNDNSNNSDNNDNPNRAYIYEDLTQDNNDEDEEDEDDDAPHRIRANISYPYDDEDEVSLIANSVREMLNIEDSSAHPNSHSLGTVRRERLSDLFGRPRNNSRENRGEVRGQEGESRNNFQSRIPGSSENGNNISLLLPERRAVDRRRNQRNGGRPYPLDLSRLMPNPRVREGQEEEEEEEEEQNRRLEVRGGDIPIYSTPPPDYQTAVRLNRGGPPPLINNDNNNNNNFFNRGQFSMSTSMLPNNHHHYQRQQRQQQPSRLYGYYSFDRQNENRLMGQNLSSNNVSSLGDARIEGNIPIMANTRVENRNDTRVETNSNDNNININNNSEGQRYENEEDSFPLPFDGPPSTDQLLALSNNRQSLENNEATTTTTTTTATIRSRGLPALPPFDSPAPNSYIQSLEDNIGRRSLADLLLHNADHDENNQQQTRGRLQNENNNNNGNERINRHLATNDARISSNNNNNNNNRNNNRNRNRIRREEVRGEIGNDSDIRNHRNNNNNISNTNDNQQHYMDNNNNGDNDGFIEMPAAITFNSQGYLDLDENTLATNDGRRIQRAVEYHMRIRDQYQREDDDDNDNDLTLEQRQQRPLISSSSITRQSGGNTLNENGTSTINGTTGINELTRFSNYTNSANNNNRSNLQVGFDPSIGHPSSSTRGNNNNRRRRRGRRRRRRNSSDSSSTSEEDYYDESSDDDNNNNKPSLSRFIHRYIDHRRN